MGTTGQEADPRIRSLNYPKTDVFVVAFSVASRKSLESAMKLWIPEVQLHCPNLPFILVGTKAELREGDGEGMVTKEEAVQAAAEIGAFGFYECSAIKQEGLKDVIDAAALAATYAERPALRTRRDVCSGRRHTH